MAGEGWIWRGRPAAIAGGVLYIASFLAAFMIYGVLEEQAKGTFFGEQASLHIVEIAPEAVLPAIVETVAGELKAPHAEISLKNLAEEGRRRRFRRRRSQPIIIR
jgi:hypothetical protein